MPALQPGVNLDLAHRVTTSVGIDAWVLPGDGIVCVARDITGTIGCNSTANTIRQGMTLEEQQQPQPGQHGNRYLLLGIAPDNVKTVAIHPDHGPPQIAQIAHNVYAYLGRSPAHIRLIHRRPLQ